MKNSNASTTDQIVEYIKRNRITTTEVADCLGKTGAVEGVSAVNRGHFRVGVVRWTCALDQSNWHVHKDLMDVKENEIVFIGSYGCGNRAVIGELVCKYCLLYMGAAAIVMDAPARDAAAIIRENYAVWSRGVSPVGCFNQKPEREEIPQEAVDAKRFFNEAIAVCDDCGVVIIPKEMHTERFLDKLHHIEVQEDIWFDRLDRHHENTFEIVCEKKYLSESSKS